MSNLGPMTTRFTRPSACTSSAIVTYTGHPSGGFYYFQGPAASYTNCYPSNWQSASGAYYSPAAQCPLSYTPACSAEETIGGTATETRVTCCPSVASIKYKCQTDPSTRFPWQATHPCVSDFTISSGSSTQLFTPLVWANTTTVTYSSFHNSNPGAVNAFGVLIYHQASDLSTISTDTTTTSSSGSPSSSTSGGTGLPIETGGGGGQETSGGLSAGAAAGVGIGVALAVLFAALGAFFVWRRKRRGAGDAEKSQVAAGAAGAPEGGDEGSAAQSGYLLGAGHPHNTSYYQPSELGDTDPHKYNGPAGAPVELPAQSVLHEMPADSHHPHSSPGSGRHPSPFTPSSGFGTVATSPAGGPQEMDARPPAAGRGQGPLGR